MTIRCGCKQIYNIHTALGEFLPSMFVKDKFCTPYSKEDGVYIRFECDICKCHAEIKVEE